MFSPATRTLLLALLLSLALPSLPAFPQTPAKQSPASQSPAPTKLNLPEDATRGLNLLYSGSPDAAIAHFRRLQSHDPSHPLGYLLEANALWWQIYCEACRIQFNMIDAWERKPLPSDKTYLSIVDQAIALADARNRAAESADMHLYAALGWALRARLVGLYRDSRATARAGVAARREALRALDLDPSLSDAYTILGLYNYYVDTLSGFIKVLRFFMGIPGGSKREGIAQLERAIAHGELTVVEARFYLALSLRNHDQQYERAIAVFSPLLEQFPRNPLFHLLLGDFYAKLARNPIASSHYNSAASLASPSAASSSSSPSSTSSSSFTSSPPPWSPACTSRILAVASEALSKLPPSPAK